MYRRTLLGMLLGAVGMAVAETPQPKDKSATQPPEKWIPQSEEEWRQNRFKVPGTLQPPGAPPRGGLTRQRQVPNLRRGAAVGGGSDGHNHL